MDYNTVYELEISMWEAAKNRSAIDFLQVVSEDAVMVCGGFRCSGKECSEIVAMFDCKTYAMEHYEIVNQDANSVQVHYVIYLEVCNEENKDLAGTFHLLLHGSVLMGHGKLYLIWIRGYLYQSNKDDAKLEDADQRRSEGWKEVNL